MAASANWLLVVTSISSRPTVGPFTSLKAPPGPRRTEVRARCGITSREPREKSSPPLVSAEPPCDAPDVELSTVLPPPSVCSASVLPPAPVGLAFGFDVDPAAAVAELPAVVGVSVVIPGAVEPPQPNMDKQAVVPTYPANE